MPYLCRLCVQIIFTLVCAAFALVVWALDTRDGHFQVQLWNVPLFSWLLVLTAIFPLLAVSKLAVDALMKLLEVALSMFEHVHYILMGLSHPLRCSIAPLWFLRMPA
jgi:heme/copper-type cytochrome/quinol oxidase subunit 1